MCNASGKCIRSSGIEDIFVESGICASGSIDKVMLGKHYNQTLGVHKFTLEALEHLLMKAFETLKGQRLGDDAQHLFDNVC